MARLRDGALSIEEVRTTTADGLMALMTAVDGLMNGLSDTVQADRQRQERMAKETCDRIERVEENFFHNFRIFLLDDTGLCQLAIT